MCPPEYLPYLYICQDFLAFANTYGVVLYMRQELGRPTSVCRAHEPAVKLWIEPGVQDRDSCMLGGVARGWLVFMHGEGVIKSAAITFGSGLWRNINDEFIITIAYEHCILRHATILSGLLKYLALLEEQCWETLTFVCI